MPEPSEAARSAAEEIVKLFYHKSWMPIVPLIEEYAAIIERHFEETERTLLQAAKWATEMSDGDECPSDLYAECPDEDCMPCSSACSKSEKMQCWIEYWKKEAAPCQEK